MRTTIVGRGNRDGAELFRKWFEGLEAAAENAERRLRVRDGQPQRGAQDLRFSRRLPGDQLAADRRAPRRARVPGRGRGLRLLARHLRLREGGRGGAAPRRRSPHGTHPQAGHAVLTNACNTYIKWAEIWERMYEIPTFTLDVPGTRQGGLVRPGRRPDFENDRQYVEAQLTRADRALREGQRRRRSTSTGCAR